MADSERYKTPHAGSQRRLCAENTTGRLSKKGAAERALLVMDSAQDEMFGD